MQTSAQSQQTVEYVNFLLSPSCTYLYYTVVLKVLVEVQIDIVFLDDKEEGLAIAQAYNDKYE